MNLETLNKIMANLPTKQIKLYIMVITLMTKENKVAPKKNVEMFIYGAVDTSTNLSMRVLMSNTNKWLESLELGFVENVKGNLVIRAKDKAKLKQYLV